jgi:hypothetical protein
MIDWDNLDKKQVAIIGVGTLAALGLSYYLMGSSRSQHKSKSDLYLDQLEKQQRIRQREALKMKNKKDSSLEWHNYS